MIILSMTATFGKLHHESLTLKPGMNIVEAPNEWGKSTWCAFLIAMLYGIETRQQTTKSALADKEHYAPWNGEPMSGRMDILWNGREITLERSAKGRTPFGELRAYETATGIEVPELTAANCGQKLLGVERSVFTRSGFIRLQDMPVTQDEALRRRLNSLVTTGDESGAGDQLSSRLKELKNKCRYNRSGLLPQAEYEREQLRNQLAQQQELSQQARTLQARQKELESSVALLENHAAALRYENARQSVEKIRQTQDTCTALELEYQQMCTRCAALPTPEQAQSALQTGQALGERQQAFFAQRQALPQPPVPPAVPECFRGLTPEEALTRVKANLTQYAAICTGKKRWSRIPLVLYGIFALLSLGAAAVMPTLSATGQPWLWAGGAILGAGLLTAVLCISHAGRSHKKAEALFAAYPGLSPDRWLPAAEEYAQAQKQYTLAAAQYEAQNGALAREQASLDLALREYAGESTLHAITDYWQEILRQHRLLDTKAEALKNAKDHLSALQAVAVTVPEPSLPDALTLTQEETEEKLREAAFELRQIPLRLGQCLGQAETVGQEDGLKARLDSVNRRITRLEEYYKALELAQEALYQAGTALQRRFAPRISKQAQSYFSRLTDGRYQKLSLSDDLSLHASAANEDTLRSAQWRSDGTTDQLYLSLRLAVAGEIIPEAPVILDDALVRFDDSRLAAALQTLAEEAGHKQVILFTCQSRENRILNKEN